MVDQTPEKPCEDADEEFSDGRERGDHQSHYPRSAWIQIAAECICLLLIATFAGLHVVWTAVPGSSIGYLCPVVGELPTAHPAGALPAPRLWSIVFFSGVLGGVTFSFKWLYHTVARQRWHRDRIIWRLAVPLQGGVLSVFIGCMILAGIIPLLSKDPFARLLTAAGFGFLVGLFADNFIAALQKVANRLLGTLADEA